MKKLIFLLMFPIALFGQGQYIPARTVFGTVNGITRPIAGATVTVCAANTGGIPCSPGLANTVFQDSGLTVPLSNPFTTDSNGNYPQAAVASGTYTVTESASGYVGFSYQLTITCTPTGSCTFGPIAATSANISGSLSAGSLNVSGSSTLQAVTATSVAVSGNETVSGSFTAGSYTNNLSVFASTTSAQLAGIISDESGSGSLLFANSNTQDSPTITTKFSITEATAPSGAVGKDVCYGDSTAHTLECSYNNGSFGKVVLDNATQTLTGKTYGGTTQNVQKFTASGTFTIPANVTSVKFTLVGGGGSGGAATASNGGSGGGSGGIAIKYLTGLTPGNTITVTVGGAGVASSISSGTQTITTVTAQPGSAGVSGTVPQTGGSGAGVSTNGDINGYGSAGDPYIVSPIGAKGGATFLGGNGNIAGGSSAGNAAQANTGSGGGGAGAGAINSGGAGGSGIVIAEWTT